MISDYELAVFELEGEDSPTHRAAAEIRELRSSLATLKGKLETAHAIIEEAAQVMGSLVEDHNDPEWADIVNACEGIRVYLAGASHE